MATTSLPCTAASIKFCSSLAVDAHDPDVGLQRGMVSFTTVMTVGVLVLASPTVGKLVDSLVGWSVVRLVGAAEGKLVLGAIVVGSFVFGTEIVGDSVTGDNDGEGVGGLPSVVTSVKRTDALTTTRPSFNA